jgi:hypothetical protein
MGGRWRGWLIFNQLDFIDDFMFHVVNLILHYVLCLISLIVDYGYYCSAPPPMEKQGWFLNSRLK